MKDNKFLGLICYSGNKEKVLETIFKLFPKDMKRFVDPFCGGLSPSLAVNCKVLANDSDPLIINMYRKLQTIPDPEMSIKGVIKEYELSRFNEEGFLKLRSDYNNTKDPLLLFTLIQHSFSNIFRVNLKGDFNVKFGNRTVNERSLKRLDLFKTKRDNITFSNRYFHMLDIEDGDFVYIDPPYLITEAVYNKYWTDSCEDLLYECIEDLDKRGIKFGLSNVISHKGKSNHKLINFLERNNFKVIIVNKRYRLDRTDGIANKTEELYITNVY